MLGAPLNCWLESDCSLHLHSYSTEDTPPPYSTSNAVGFIVGIGNLGKELKYTAEELNTYLSRDGGLNWIELKKGTYMVKFGDHDSIIIAAPLFKPTRTIQYSFD